MKTNKLALTLVVAGALALPSLPRAQASASIQLNLGLPVVMPQLVVVQPGIRVVPDIEEEVFFTNGFYWCRHDDGWYRTRDVRRGWYYMEPHRVPPGLTRMPPGRYKKYRPASYAPARTRYAPAPARYRDHDYDRHRDHDGHRDRDGHRDWDRDRHHDDDHGRKHKGGHGKHGRD